MYIHTCRQTYLHTCIQGHWTGVRIVRLSTKMSTTCLKVVVEAKCLNTFTNSEQGLSAQLYCILYSFVFCASFFFEPLANQVI